MASDSAPPDGPRHLLPLLRHAVERFAHRFRLRPTLAVAAPGRVNLIGEHTDYNDGLVLPMAIDRAVVIAGCSTVAPRSTILAIDVDEEITTSLIQPDRPASLPPWARHVVGVIQQCSVRGRQVPNLDLAFTSTVPIGAGLSSSAAIEVATATFVEQVLRSPLDPLDKARLCQRAEHEFVATPCGIMDMLVATCARSGHALFIDCRSLQTRHVPMPPAESVTLLVIDTGVRRSLAAGAYAARQETCLATARKFHVPALRDATQSMLDDATTSPDERRFARHVIEENTRVVHAVESLESGDIESLGDLMFQSHASLRDLFNVSCAELDTVIQGARQLRESGAGVYGARLTGAGFGGCAIVLCRTESMDPVRDALIDRFRQAHGRPPGAFAVHASAGAARLDLDVSVSR